MPRKRKSQEYVTREALTDEGLSAHDRARFHYFNPRGAHARQGLIDGRVSALVDARLCKSGAMLAYGGFDDYHRKALWHLVDLKTGPERAKLHVVVSMYEERNARAEAFVHAVLAEAGWSEPLIASWVAETDAQTLAEKEALRKKTREELGLGA